MKIINIIVFVDICRYLDLFRAAPASFSIEHKFISYLIFVTGATGGARVNFCWPV